MPTYRITDPKTGKTVKVTGDSPPSEAELTEIFATLAPTDGDTPPTLSARRPMSEAFGYPIKYDDPNYEPPSVGEMAARGAGVLATGAAGGAIAKGVGTLAARLPVRAMAGRVASVLKHPSVGVVSPRTAQAGELLGRFANTGAATAPRVAPAVAETVAPTVASSGNTINAAMERAVALAKQPVPASAPSVSQAMTTLQKTPGVTKVKLTAAEVSAGRDLIRKGMTGPEALDAIVQLRQMPAAWRSLPTNAQVRSDVTARNATGRWGAGPTRSPSP